MKHIDTDTEVSIVNVYDFDKTIYAGDSSIDFWKFYLQHSPA